MEWQLGKMRVMIFSYTLVYPLLVNVPGHSLHGVVVVAVVVFCIQFYSSIITRRSLPFDIRRIRSSQAFRTALKTHVYKQHHNK